MLELRLHKTSEGNHVITPVIVLETLSQAKIKSLLWCTYLILIVGIVLSVIESNVGHSTYVLNGNSCENNVFSGSESCTVSKDDGDSLWYGVVDLSRLQLYFAITVDGVPYDNATNSQFVVETTCSISGGHDLHNVIYEKHVNITVNCGVELCKTTHSLLSEWDWMYHMDSVYSTYTVAVFYKQFNFDAIAVPKYTVWHHVGSYRLAQVVIRVVLLPISGIILAYWVYRVHFVPESVILHQQYWVTICLVAVIFIIDPFYTPLVYYQVEALWIVSGIVVWIGRIVLLMFWLAMIHGMASRPRSWWAFYIPKAVFGGTLFLGVLVVSILLPYFSPSYVIVVISVIIFSVCALYWVVMMYRYTKSTAAKLRCLPYVTSRFAQLSFRFFVMQTALVILFALIHGILYVALTPKYLGQYWGDISSVVVLSVYIWVVAYVYLPTRSKVKVADSLNVVDSPNNALAEAREYGSFKQPLLKQTNYSRSVIYQGEGSDFDFSLHTALWLVYFANQAYYDAPSQERSMSSCGQANFIEHFGFRLVQYISDEEQDVHCYLFQRDNIVVVTFRGTASMKNAINDLHFTRVTATADLFPGLRQSVMVHEGFWRAYSAIRNDVDIGLGYIHQAWTDPVPLRVFVTGHSLGGALAHLAAYSFSTRLELDVIVYTFGGPRVGNHAWAEEYDDRVPHTYRICFNRDMVTTIPKFCFMFKHVGTEVHVDARGNWIIQPSFVEKILNPRRTNLTDHLMYSYLRGIKNACILEQNIAQFVTDSSGVGDTTETQPLITPSHNASEGLDLIINLPARDSRVTIPAQLDSYFK